MKIRALVILLSLVSVNASSSIVVAESVSTPISRFVAPSFSTVPFLSAKEIRQQAKRDKLKRVVQYLTTRVHKTGYVFSGSTVSGWDCSGMVRYAYQRMNVLLPHSADKQGHVGFRVSSPRIGDIVVFAYKGSTSFYHSAIYVGEGLIVNANLMYRTTVIQPLSDFRNSQVRFVRVIN